MNNELMKDFKISISMLNKYLKANNKVKEITIVGGFAIYLLDNNFDRITTDIDVLSDLDNKDIYSFGFSSLAESVIKNFGNYKKDRIELKNFSTSFLKVYVISPERIISSKQISNRLIPDLEDIKYIQENFKINNKKVNEFKKEAHNA